jgi:ferredoxin/NAD-dependent dihydropyrimidine dehydrogenase PreA subunit
MSQRMVELTIDGTEVSVPEGSTLLDACNELQIDTPTLCYGDTLSPANACRVCMVELEGARTLVPACSRMAEDGMDVRTDSERVRLNRRLVFEFLASSVDLSTTPGIEVYIERYEAKPERYGPPAPPDPEREHHRAGHHAVPDGQTAATVAGPTKVDNELYVRDYSKCVLCYKCVDACGEQHQSTFAITVAGRGFDRLPDRRADAEHRIRAAGERRLGRVAADHDRHDLRVLWRRLQPHAPRAGQQDRQGGLARRSRRDARQPVREGAVRVRARQSARSGCQLRARAGRSRIGPLT